MPFYRDAETFYEVMNDLFSQVMARPDLLKPLRDGKVMLRITTTAPDTILVVDGRAVPPRFPRETIRRARSMWGSSCPPISSQRLAGQNWPARRLPGRQIHLDSSPLKALSLMTGLLEMFRFVESLYPGVLKKRGLL